MSNAPAVPLWLVALALACAAPFVVSAIQWLVERRRRYRTLAFIERAGLRVVDGSVDARMGR